MTADLLWQFDLAWALADLHLTALVEHWRAALTQANPAAPSVYPWGEGTEYIVAHTALWVNVELTKNISEIGQLRLLRAARR